MQKVRSARSKQERDWKLNTAFYRGDQWIWFNRYTGQVADLPQPEDGGSNSYRVRLTANQILPGVQGLLAMMTKTKPVITATPDSGSARDISAAQVGEQLFEHLWRELGLKAKRDEALLWSILGSAGYWRISWDPFAGKQMTFLVDPNGQPVLDQQFADILREELTQDGHDPRQFEKTVYMGDIRVDVVPPDAMYVLDAATNFADSKAVVCRHPMTPDEVKMRYGVDLKPNAKLDGFQIPGGSQSTSGENDVIEVYVGYFVPTSLMPKGRYVVFTEDQNTAPLFDGPWPFPTHHMPFVEFPGPCVPGSMTNEAVVTHARPLQKELNRTISQIVMHKNLTLKPQLLAPQGSLTQQLTDEPGAIIEFLPIGNNVPQWREMPSIPAYVFEHLKDIQFRLDRLFNLQAITRGDVPPNVEAGIAIDLLQEAAVDQIAPVIQAMEDSLAKAGDLMAVLAKEFYTEPRTLKIVGPGGTTKVKQFLGSDLGGGFTFYAEAGSGLPRTRAGRQARIEQLVGMGVMRPDQAWKHLDIADLKGLAATFAADEEQAYREHEKLTKGDPINEMEMQHTISMLQQGLNPETGQPLQGTEDMQALVEQAALQPLPFENYQTHLDTHKLYMTSVEFESLPPDAKARYIEHFTATLQAMQNIPARPEPQAVRTNLQIKATADPETVSEILRHSGVPEATAENLSHPPLESWVSDSVDKPDASDAGNNELNEMEQLHSMQQAEEKHQVAQARAAADISLVQKRASQIGKQTENRSKGA